MTLPEIVRGRLGDEDARARVSLGGDDELLVTPSRVVVYRAEGLLSGESVEDYGLDAERVSINEGRRKSTVTLDHGIEGDSQFTIPSNRLEDALRPLLEGVLASAGVTGSDEAIRHIHRLGELTLVITDARTIKHIGSNVWDTDDFEEFDYEHVTDLDIERGEVSSQIIVEVEGRPQWIKTPSAEAREIHEHIKRPLFEYHGVGSYAEFRDLVTPDEEDEDEEPTDDEATDDAEAADDGGDGGREAGRLRLTSTSTKDVESAVEEDAADGDVAAEVAGLRAAVERQNELLEAHQRTIEQLIEELKRGR